MPASREALVLRLRVRLRWVLEYLRAVVSAIASRPYASTLVTTLASGMGTLSLSFCGPDP